MHTCIHRRGVLFSLGGAGGRLTDHLGMGGGLVNNRAHKPFLFFGAI